MTASSTCRCRCYRRRRLHDLALQDSELPPTVSRRRCRCCLELYTGCSLNIVFFPKILKYSGLWPFSVLPRCQCVYTRQAGRKPALQQSWQSSETSQHFKEKNTIFNEHPVPQILPSPPKDIASSIYVVSNFSLSVILLIAFS